VTVKSFSSEHPDIQVIKADSGKGKSTFLAGVLHLIEHTGDMYFIENGEWKNVHDSTKEWLNSSICLIKEENLDPSSRLVDIFKDCLIKKMHSSYLTIENRHGKTLTELAKHAHDNLLEHEINAILSHQKSVFPVTMLDDLKSIRRLRSLILKEVLENSDGSLNISRITPERVFGTLSSGEKRRIITTYSCEYILTHQECKILILDEPLSHLDSSSIEFQIQKIKSIQQIKNPPVILIISHLMLEEIRQKLDNVSILEL